MGSEAEKSKQERSALLEFIECSRRAIDPSSIEKRLPPEPDLLCRDATDGLIAFELVEICDPKFAEALSQPQVFRFIRKSDPSAAIVQKKLQCTYVTDHPVELLCYVEGRAIVTADAIIPTITGVLQSSHHIFNRVWLLCEGRAHLLHGTEA